MLPKTLAVSLSYLCIAGAVFISVVIESEIALLFSVLLLLTGFLLLWLHYHSKDYSETRPAPEVHQIKNRNWNDIFQAEQERRMVGLVQTFPLIDNNGNLIPFDRRVVSQRGSEAA